MEMGGARSLSALLHSKHEKLVYQAALALSHVSAESDDNKLALATDNSLADLCHAARSGYAPTQRLIASIFLDLMFCSEIRAQLAAMNSPGEFQSTSFSPPNTFTIHRLA